MLGFGKVPGGKPKIAGKWTLNKDVYICIYFLLKMVERCKPAMLVDTGKSDMPTNSHPGHDNSTHDTLEAIQPNSP